MSLDDDVDARGTRRRLQALAAIGWSTASLSDLIGIEDAEISRWLVDERVSRADHDVVAALYDWISDTAPATDTFEARVVVAATIARASRAGYALPIEWDDIDTDEGPARPEPTDELDLIAIELAVKQGARVRLTTAERREAVRQLHERQLSDREISQMLGCADKTVMLDRHAMGLPPVVAGGRPHAGQKNVA